MSTPEEAAGYVVSGPNGAGSDYPAGALAGLSNAIPYGIPLVIQEKTFIPTPDQLATEDPTWNATKWGGLGSLWVPHVYMPAQDPNDPSGMSAFGRWMYGPYFWPPASPMYGPIANPYFRRDLRPRCCWLVPAAADPGHAEPVRWDGALQRHARRQRHRVPEAHSGSGGIPLSYPEMHPTTASGTYSGMWPTLREPRSR